MTIFAPIDASRQKKRAIDRLQVGRLPGDRFFLRAGQTITRCAIGKNFSRHKTEGDLCTPIGRFAILHWRRRPGCWFGPIKGRWRLTKQSDGWCDDSKAGAYNQPVLLPFPFSCETMWRADDKYHLVGVMDYNLRPRRAHAGSAIFFHIADDCYAPTAGCVALRAQDMRRIAPRLAGAVVVDILSERRPVARTAYKILNRKSLG